MPIRHSPIDRGDGGYAPTEARGDYEILASGGALWLLPCVMVLLFALAPFGHDPLPADRLANLGLALDDPIVAVIPMDGPIRLPPEPPSLGEVFRDLSSDYGAPDTGSRSGHDLTVGTADGSIAGGSVRPSWLDHDPIPVPIRPYLLIEGTHRGE